MGTFRIKPIVQLLAWIIAAVLVYLNIRMVSQEAMGFFSQNGHWAIKALIIAAALFFAYLLLFSIIFPLINKIKKRKPYICTHMKAFPPTSTFRYIKNSHRA